MGALHHPQNVLSFLLYAVQIRHFHHAPIGVRELTIQQNSRQQTARVPVNVRVATQDYIVPHFHTIQSPQHARKILSEERWAMNQEQSAIEQLGPKWIRIDLWYTLYTLRAIEHCHMGLSGKR